MNWLKQSQEPLFPEILWSRPENKRQAGKLLIVGGNLHNFSSVSTAYAAATQAGIGTCKLLLPTSLQKTLKNLLPEAEFAASTPSGSFARLGLGHLLESSEWADCVLLAGDFGRNSETAILLESFVDKYSGLLAVGDDALDYFVDKPLVLLDRPNTVLVPTMGQLQKMLKRHVVIKHNADLAQIVKVLQELDSRLVALIVPHAGQVIVASADQVSTTPLEDPQSARLAAAATVYWLQNPVKPFESITSSVFNPPKLEG